jgi:hypothetical protein
MANAQHAITLGLSRRLADLLVEEGLITSPQLKQALDEQKTGGDKLGTLLIDKGFLAEEKLLQFLAEKTGISFVSLADIGEISEEAVAAVPETICIFTVKPKGIIVIGSLSDLDTRSKRETFQRFRKSIHGVDILTFDELYQRARFIVDHKE